MAYGVGDDEGRRQRRAGADLVLDRQNHQAGRRLDLERDVVHEERLVDVVFAMPLEGQRVLARGQDDAAYATVPDIAAGGLLLGIDDLAVDQHPVEHRLAGVDVGAVLALPGQRGDAGDVVREDLRQRPVYVDGRAVGAGDEGRGLVWAVAGIGSDGVVAIAVAGGPVEGESDLVAAVVVDYVLKAAVDEKFVGDGIAARDRHARVVAPGLAGRGDSSDAVCMAVRRLERAAARRGAAFREGPARAGFPVRDREARLRRGALRAYLFRDGQNEPRAEERVVVEVAFGAGGEAAGAGELQRRGVVADVRQRRHAVRILARDEVVDERIRPPDL